MLEKFDILDMSPEELEKFVHSIIGPPRRTLEGKEREQAWLILHMSEPTRTHNNQHSWTEEYYIGGKYYDVHYFPNEQPIIDEVSPE